MSVSSGSTPLHNSATHSPSPAPSSKFKATNVFSNDGSFLERFYSTKKEEEEKMKQEQAVSTKRNFEDRFKKRGKRPPPTDAETTTGDSTNGFDDEPSVKKLKTEKQKPLTKYEQEVQKSTPNNIKDEGMGVRPMVK